MLYHPDGPIILNVETTNHCNLKCPYCPHNDMTRPKGFMDDQTFKKCIEDSHEIATLRYIQPFRSGEAFVDKKIYERIRYINEHAPDKGVRIFTNFSIPLKKEELETCELDKMVISYNTEPDPQILDDNARIIRELEIPCDIHVVGDIEEARVHEDPLVQSALQFGRKHGMYVHRTKKYNWHGLIPSEHLKVKNGYCFRPRRQIQVLWDGRVDLCCMDINGEVILGNVHEQSLKEIWNSDIARKYRETPKFSLDFCRECNMQVVQEATQHE